MQISQVFFLSHKMKSKRQQKKTHTHMKVEVVEVSWDYAMNQHMDPAKCTSKKEQPKTECFLYKPMTMQLAISWRPH